MSKEKKKMTTASLKKKKVVWTSWKLWDVWISRDQKNYNSLPIKKMVF